MLFFIFILSLGLFVQIQVVSRIRWTGGM